MVRFFFLKYILVNIVKILFIECFRVVNYDVRNYDVVDVRDLYEFFLVFGVLSVVNIFRFLVFL